jgi:hypothetical protein
LAGVSIFNWPKYTPRSGVLLNTNKINLLLSRVALYRHVGGARTAHGERRLFALRSRSIEKSAGDLVHRLPVIVARE